MPKKPKHDYEELYISLATHCYLIVMCYEKYLLDEVDHLELAVAMKELLETLPSLISSDDEEADSPSEEL